MGKDDYSKTVSRQYNRLLEQCNVHMDRFEKEYPEPRDDFQALLKERGVSRRDFVKWTSFMTAALMLPPVFEPMVARAAENFSRLPVVWLHFAECTGCSEAFLRSSYPNVDDILLDTISLEYHETLMAAAGNQAERIPREGHARLPRQVRLRHRGGHPAGSGRPVPEARPQGQDGSSRSARR